MPISSRTHARMCLLALGVSACVLMPALARAESPSEQESVQSSWRPTPPTLSLQPEAGRVFLRVPPEWLPPDRRLDPFARDQRAMFWREWTPRWTCHVMARCMVCNLGGAPPWLGSEIRPRFAFDVTVLPRAAVAMLRFDPIPPRFR